MILPLHWGYLASQWHAEFRICSKQSLFSPSFTFHCSPPDTISTKLFCVDNSSATLHLCLQSFSELLHPILRLKYQKPTLPDTHHFSQGLKTSRLTSRGCTGSVLTDARNRFSSEIRSPDYFHLIESCNQNSQFSLQSWNNGWNLYSNVNSEFVPQAGLVYIFFLNEGWFTFDDFV